jgi:hypothetical protein
MCGRGGLGGGAGAFDPDEESDATRPWVPTAIAVTKITTPALIAHQRTIPVVLDGLRFRNTRTPMAASAAIMTTETTTKPIWSPFTPRAYAPRLSRMARAA